MARLRTGQTILVPITLTMMEVSLTIDQEAFVRDAIESGR
jgi:hypothetical protein